MWLLCNQTAYVAVAQVNKHLNDSKFRYMMSNKSAVLINKWVTQ